MSSPVQANDYVEKANASLKELKDSLNTEQYEALVEKMNALDASSEDWLERKAEFESELSKASQLSSER